MKIKKKYYITAILVIFGLVVTNATGSIENMATTENNFDIDDDDKIISVLVFLKDQVDLKEITRQMDEQKATLQMRHEVTVVSLQNTAYNSQPQLIEYLEELHDQKIVKEFKPFWISNVIRVDTYQCVVDAIAQRDDVLKIYHNYNIELIEPLSSDIENALLRICQESLTNVRKHAKASEVEVNLIFEGNKVKLSIQDNGIGFKTEVKNESAFGLISMRERARLLGGKLEINSEIGNGTLIQVTIPVKRR